MGLIEAEVLKKDLDAEIIFDSRDRYRVRDLIDIQPIIEAEPVRHGRWIGRWIREPNCWYRCSVCGDHYPSIADNMKYNYCPNCGAKMEEQE